MNDAVSHALVARGREATGFTGMLGVSAAAHVALVVAVVLVGVTAPARMQDERNVMTISLGGPPGPRSGGMTPIGGRPVQQITETAPARRPEPIRPPAPTPPAMTVPTKAARPAPKPAPPAKATATESARSGAPARGTETRAGSAVVDTGARGIGFGISSGGGGTGGEIDLSNFCCPDYLSTMLDLIQRNWNSKQQVGGMASIRFSIHRDGAIRDVQVARSSGYAVLDLTAQRAVVSTRMPPLPSAYTNDLLTVTLNFEYQR